MRESLNLVITGHVDHGKSTLIGRLLYDTDSLPNGFIESVKKTCDELGKDMEFGFVLDSLEEERKQGITIDTTQIFFKTKKRDYVIIDAPGHIEFIRNMITGASQADAAIIIIDAKEGIKEQTRRHAYILSLLGISQIIIAVNKMDLLNWSKSEFEKIKGEINQVLKNLSLSARYILPVSAKHGDNIAAKSKNIDSEVTILEALDTLENEREKIAELRFPIQDVYKFDDERILAGRIESGKLEQGQEVLFLPSNKKAKIKSVQKWNDKNKKTEQGESVGIILDSPLFIERGETACDAGTIAKPTKKINAAIFWISKPEENLTLKLTTQETKCKIHPFQIIDSSTLKPKQNQEINDILKANITLEKQIIADKFSDIQNTGRFILENEIGETVAAGTINDCFPA